MLEVCRANPCLNWLTSISKEDTALKCLHLPRGSRRITNYAAFLEQWFGKSIDRPNRCACQADCAAIAVGGLDRITVIN